METLISQLLDLPEQVHRGDFVLNLSEGVTAGKAERTLADYVVTPQLADAFDNALAYRANVGDERFFDLLGAGAGDSKWGKRALAWTHERFEAAMAAPPGDDVRGSLVGDLVKSLFQGYRGVTAGKTESFLSLDK